MPAGTIKSEMTEDFMRYKIATINMSKTGFKPFSRAKPFRCICIGAICLLRKWCKKGCFKNFLYETEPILKFRLLQFSISKGWIPGQAREGDSRELYVIKKAGLGKTCPTILNPF